MNAADRAVDLLASLGPRASELLQQRPESPEELAELLVRHDLQAVLVDLLTPEITRVEDWFEIACVCAGRRTHLALVERGRDRFLVTARARSDLAWLQHLLALPARGAGLVIEDASEQVSS